MQMGSVRYSWCCSLQSAMLLLDLVLSSVALFPRDRDALLLIFIFQDVFLVLSLTLLLMMYFSTYLFQSGAVQAVWARARSPAAAAALYLSASVSLHAASLWQSRPAPAFVLALLALQRTVGCWYYFSQKRAMLRAADPRLHSDIDWPHAH